MNGTDLNCHHRFEATGELSLGWITWDICNSFGENNLRSLNAVCSVTGTGSLELSVHRCDWLSGKFLDTLSVGHGNVSHKSTLFGHPTMSCFVRFRAICL